MINPVANGLLLLLSLLCIVVCVVLCLFVFVCYCTCNTVITDCIRCIVRPVRGLEYHSFGFRFNDPFSLLYSTQLSHYCNVVK